MNFIFRGFKSLKERKGKTIITLLVMLTVCLVILTSFSIQSATNGASVMARQKLGAQVSLTQDMEKLMSQGGNSEEGGKRGQISRISVPLSYLDELTASEYVIDYTVASSTSANLSDLTAVGVEESEDTEEATTAVNDRFGSGGAVPSKMGAMGDVTITGLNNMNNEAKVSSGAIELLEGRELTDEDINTNSILVETNFAELNSLSLGDTISLTSASDETIIVEGEIVGIYKDSSEVSESAYRMTSMLPYNNIYTSYTLANTLKGENYAESVDSISVYLNDPINIDAYIEATNKSTVIDFNTFKLDANSSAYEAMVGPIENVASFSKTTLIIITVFGGVILTLIIMLSIKDRVNEIGILMALGEKKFKIIGQLLSEMIIVLVLSLGISMCLGSPISDKVADTLIAKEVAVQEESVSNTGFGGKNNMNRNPMGGSSTANVEVIDELDVSISAVDFGKMAVSSLGIAMLATILPAVFIMRLNPKTILSQHN